MYLVTTKKKDKYNGKEKTIHVSGVMFNPILIVSQIRKLFFFFF